MADLLRDDDGDIPIRAQLVSGPVDIRQRVQLRLRRFLGEWFLDLELGLPFLDWLQQKPLDVGAVVARIREEIELVEGVVGTQDFSSSLNEGERSVTITGEFVIAPDVIEQITITSDPTTLGMPFSIFYSRTGVF